MNGDKVIVHRFAIRAHDLDATAMASVTAFIRFLENQRWHALASDGYLSSFFDNGVMRSQIIELNEQISFNEEIEVVMWLSKVGRTSFNMGHTLKHKDTGAIFGRAAVTVVALTLDGLPKEVPSGVRQYVSDQETLEIPRLKLSPQPGAWSHSFPVRFTDLDLLQHVNESRYVEYVEDARHACARAGGYGLDSAPATARIRRLAVSYEGQARLGDTLRVTTWAVDDRPGSYEFEMRTEPQGALMALARAEVED